jgi:hypothetical protein
MGEQIERGFISENGTNSGRDQSTISLESRPDVVGSEIGVDRVQQTGSITDTSIGDGSKIA